MKKLAKCILVSFEDEIEKVQALLEYEDKMSKLLEEIIKRLKVNPHTMWQINCLIRFLPMKYRKEFADHLDAEEKHRYLFLCNPEFQQSLSGSTGKLMNIKVSEQEYINLAIDCGCKIFKCNMSPNSHDLIFKHEKVGNILFTVRIKEMGTQIYQVNPSLEIDEVADKLKSRIVELIKNNMENKKETRLKLLTGLYLVEVK